MMKPTMKSDVEIPQHNSNYNSFSLEAKEWLTNYSVYEEDVYKYNISHTEDNSLLFLNKRDGVVVGFQKRNIKERFITTTGQKVPMLLKPLVETNILVIVEDFISAVRVAQQYNALCLWGTKINEAELYKYVGAYSDIYVWLDNDSHKEVNSGQEAAKDIRKRINKIVDTLSLKRGFYKNTKTTINVATEKDPKCYTNTEITNIIEAAYVYIKQ